MTLDVHTQSSQAIADKLHRTQALINLMRNIVTPNITLDFTVAKVKVG